MRGQPSARMPMLGFTLVEVLVTVTVIAILAAIVITSDRGYLARSRDTQRQNSIATISRALERYYRTNATVNGPTYPATSAGASGVAALIDDASVTYAPGQSSNSIVVAVSNATQTPTVDQYIYQPLTTAGAICNTPPCSRYILYYQQETDATVVSLNSVRQQ